MEVSSLRQKEDTKTGVCRVCLNCETDETGKALSLFEKHNEILISEKINYIANVEIREGDGLPDKICSTCLLALENACNFKEKCENSDAILQSALQLGVPVHEQPIEVPVKEEISLEYEYDYLDQTLHSPAALQSDNDVKSKSEDDQSNTFKSRAIDLKLECHDCGAFLKSKCKMRVHWKQVHQPKYLTCPKCNKTFKSFKAYHSHLKKETKSCRIASKLQVEGEGKSRIYHCKECDYHSNRLQSMMAHQVVHSGDRPYSCNICGKSYTQLGAVISHKERAHHASTSTGTCHLCGKHFKSRSNLYSHMRTHKDNQVSCKVCFKTLKGVGNLKQHMKRHSGIKAYTCEICAKTFYTTSDLGNHKSKRHGEKKVYSCHICGYKTTNAYNLSKHRSKHSPDNVACEVCGKFLENEQQLALHKKRHFEKDCQCHYCEKLFYGRRNLLNHVRKKHKVFAFSTSQSVIEKERKKSQQLKTHHGNVKVEQLTPKL